ncbi:threonine-phosphate decarboxylase CobD [Acetohalobium arabaticum]|uniref:threonine-phosphate decarboxylase n=1 Tax=Acetohalobium arabaticum (strain ATCC 49924 / DSM 5501 / Z-7288) TaxID=574087 RepID=D9QVX3_ACEAZ|nr:threonine-phosphate decarboxylase CobD [Acetohalobium arabaticum]ADL12382.1 L-threonine-O-3-phosphate decarboxylase [Acetohalobium arabaticum DSM 5501]
MASNKRIHGGNIKAAADKYGLKPDKIIDFSANINFLGPPAVVEDVIKDNLDDIVNYPEPNAQSLSLALAEYHGVEAENLIVGNGAVELIYLVSKVISPEQALVLAPTFSEYEAAVESVGGEVNLFELNRANKFSLEIDELIVELNNSQLDLLFLCNPNNPTGDLISKDDLLKLLATAEKNDVFVIVDEAFLDFLWAEADYTLISKAAAVDNLLVLRSMTKFFAIPGLRVGYAVTNRQLVTKLEENKDPWNVNLFAQRVGTEVVAEDKYIQKTKEAINREKKFLYQSLEKLTGCEPYQPAANYILIDISKTEYTSTELKDRLASKGILIRDCSSYHLLGSNFIRVAVKGREDNQQLIAALKSLLEAGGE